MHETEKKANVNGWNGMSHRNTINYAMRTVKQPINNTTLLETKSFIDFQMIFELFHFQSQNKSQSQRVKTTSVASARISMNWL